MELDRLKQLSGLLEEAAPIIPVGLYFSITDHKNMQLAVDEILKAGFEVELAYSMGTYYFNFQNKKVFDEAKRLVFKVIDVKKEVPSGTK